MKHTNFNLSSQSVALPENIVEGRNYRFTILTPRLIRMEFSKNGVFENRPSQSVFFRNFPKNTFSVKNDEVTLEIETEHLILRYSAEKEFLSDSLSISLKVEPMTSWRFSEDFEDLGGTVSTLDGINGEIPLGRGVCSRDGFSVFDDSESMLLDDDELVAVRQKDSYDVYFFGYGFDYLSAVKDFYRLTGAPEMLPKYALGNWWSRFHKYTQDEYTNLIKRFKDEDIPFSVAVIDMDWHITEIPEDLKDPDPDLTGGREGWTGYSWNKELFPDYRGFLSFLHSNGMHTALNLHPAQGVRRHEDMYEAMALAEGIDPASGKRVPFNILSKDSMRNYFDILLHPYEDDGVDFWWMDWQQGKSYAWIHEPNKDGVLQDEREVLDPLWMLNHMHIADIVRNGKRPMYFSRYAGPGSHRYSIGFSGDTFVTWQSLAFQPYFTATASNIGYCWWSHDIGGHFFGYSDRELATRWLQLGVFSPINRLHSCNNEFQGKEPWNYGMECGPVMTEFLRLRYRLLPYIYTMNYRAHSDLQPLVQPMYYSHPKCSGAYDVKNQFWFGSELMVAPITEPCDNVDKMGRVKVWLPEGEWFDFFNGTMYKSKRGRMIDVFRNIDEYPVFAKAGAIVPMMRNNSNCIQNPELLEIVVFPGADNSFTLYEDEGEYDRFEDGAFVKTEMIQSFSDSKCTFTILPAEGELSLIPEFRKWIIKFRGYCEKPDITVSVNSEIAEFECLYEEGFNTTSVIIGLDVNKTVTVTLEAQSLYTDNRFSTKRCFEILLQSDIPYDTKHTLNECVNNKWSTRHQKIRQIYRTIPHLYHLASALKEQITLIREEFE